ncbi:MAG: hypothetical protein ABSA53_31725 [Streptosporangiaceae bacterium]|jgi:hypothetical protein
MRSQQVAGKLTWRRWARRLGLDRNPLRRRTDRIEAALRLTMITLALVAVPVTVIAVGRWADHLALHRVRAQRATEHLVNAVLLAPAPATGVPDPYTSVQLTWVLARWTPPGRPARTGEVPAVAGARRGTLVPTWISASGAVAAPPPAHREIIGDVCIACMTTCLVSLLVLLEVQVLVRRVLDRRRLTAWEAEWRANGPQWTARPGPRRPRGRS